jgi:hypothetical protein
MPQLTELPCGQKDGAVGILSGQKEERSGVLSGQKDESEILSGQKDAEVEIHIRGLDLQLIYDCHQHWLSWKH